MKVTHTTSFGSSMLIIVFIMTALLIAGAALWRSTSLMIEIGHKRQQHTQRTYLTESLLYYGVALCKEQVKYLLTEAQSGKKTHTLSLQAWPPGTGAYQGTLVITTEEKVFTLTARLVEKQMVVCSAQCKVTYKVDAAKKLTALSIDAWTFNVA